MRDGFVLCFFLTRIQQNGGEENAKKILECYKCLVLEIAVKNYSSGHNRFGAR